MAYPYHLAVLDLWYFITILVRKCIWIYPGMKIAQTFTVSHVQIEKSAIQSHSITSTHLINL